MSPGAASRAFLALLLGLMQPAIAAEPDLRLGGTITGADHQHFIAKPFAVPAGVTAISVDFTYDRSGGTVIDLGLLDDQRFRGWSGGNKAQFVVGDTVATPSYLAGPVAGRRFTLLMGVPNARPGSRSDWRADISFERAGPPAAAPPAATPLRSGPGWFRGDLHSHSGHSDGTCTSDAGTRVPCPVYRSVEAAARAGLDFLAVTDHNTVSHLSELAGLQPAFSRLLLIPGQEVTTFQGHANVLGVTALAEFRIGTPQMPDGAAWSRAMAKLGGVISVNHPALPSGAACMGCGWTLPGTDWRSITAIEIANGGAMAITGGRLDTPLSGIKYWEKLLSEGHRLAPIAGSDNHDPALAAPDPRAIGSVVTAIWADALSTPAIMAGLRSGRVFVDADAAAGRTLELFALTPAGKIPMGGTARLPTGAELPVEIALTRCTNCTITLIINGTPQPPRTVAGPDTLLAMDAPITRPGWLRAEVRDAVGRLVLVGNAIHLAAQ
ncbi:CehA/McbA family metallohydrolase [Sandarakinorhabdus sp.]|uniref:CehA/McbA family metallohydrolase n=1 Tax=Sandarakinorhabdus sp. TaxID=1916663 RepID=UPI00333F178D